MLLQLEIKNFAIIDHTIINFEAGFNVLTGETGAGKSILIDALSAVLGERTSKDFIRKHEDKAKIKAVFQKTTIIEEKLKKIGLEFSDDVLILERILMKNGRTLTKINGSIQTVQVIKEVTNLLIEICGQKEHLHLLQDSHYLSILDKLAGTEHKENILSYQTTFKEYKAINETLDTLLNRQREQEQLHDLYLFQYQEIEQAGLKLGEEEELENEKRILSSFEKISNAVGRSLQFLEGTTVIYQAQNELEDAAKYEERMATLAERLDKVYLEIEDIKNEVDRYHSSMEYDEERLNEIMHRLELYKNMKRKYGDTTEDILRYFNEIAEKIDEVENKEEKVESLKKEKKEAEEKMQKMGEMIHQKREEVAKEKEAVMNQELHELYMPHASLLFKLEKTEDYLSNGITRISVLFSANKGEDVKPLSKVASGGELSRISLAMKIATNTEKDFVLIFDEVDEGVGGEVGRIIGEKLYRLGYTAQVISISHLPQVAAKADHHFLIEKSSDETRTVSKVKKLTMNQRKEEIARMIFGDHADEITLKQAEEMLKK